CIPPAVAEPRRRSAENRRDIAKVWTHEDIWICRAIREADKRYSDAMAPNPDEQIFRLAKEWAVDLAAETAARVGRFCAVLLEWNNRVNLTGAKSLADLLAEHVPDSFVAARLIPENASVIDIGSGGGLPGIPLAIRSEEHTSELQSLTNLVCRLL